MNFRKTILESFWNDSQKPHHRYKSWIHCFKFFRKRPKRINKQWLNLASLNLSMYLASWGMWRGSTFSINLDYKSYKCAIRILTKKKYDVLWDLDIATYDKEFLKNKISPLVRNLINELIKVIKSKLEYTIGKNSKKNVTQTLITKIIMGTIGCMPAYDNYFLEGIEKTKASIARNIFNKRETVFDTLIEYYFDNDNKRMLDKIKKQLDGYELRMYKKDGVKYPIMKLIDMHFWIIGRKEIARRKRIMKRNTKANHL